MQTQTKVIIGITATIIFITGIILYSKNKKAELKLSSDAPDESVDSEKELTQSEANAVAEKIFNAIRSEKQTTSIIAQTGTPYSAKLKQQLKNAGYEYEEKKVGGREGGMMLVGRARKLSTADNKTILTQSQANALAEKILKQKKSDALSKRKQGYVSPLGGWMQQLRDSNYTYAEKVQPTKTGSFKYAVAIKNPADLSGSIRNIIGEIPENLMKGTGAQ